MRDFKQNIYKNAQYREGIIYGYENIGDAYYPIGEFIEQVYNQKQLHQAL